MPKWGFTQEMRNTRPWGLPPEELEPGKVVADPVHGDVHLTRLEMRVVDSRPFQRLRRVRQLGSTHLVYPGATHSRFSHALGAVRAAQNLLDFAVEQREGIHPVPDLLGQWAASSSKTYDRELARATVVGRLGALLHDLGHVPFGHSIEDEMGILLPHDANEWRLNQLWREFEPELRDLLAGEDLELALKTVIAPKLKLGSPAIQGDYPFVNDLVGNTICADLLDYLVRDHAYSGLPMALGNRFLSALFVTPDGENKFFRRRMALNIARDGRERADVVTELLKYLRYRYELTERVLTHHAKLRADAMIGKMLLLWRDDIAEKLRTEADAPLSGKLAKGKADRVLEEELLWRGDDGLLEYLQGFVRDDESPSWRAKAVAQLANEVIHRELFELAGRCNVTLAPVHQLRQEYGDPEKRLVLEQELAEYAEVEAWKVAIWLPPEDMGLKIARVLVYDGSRVMQFNEYEAHGRKRGSEIDEAHKALWAVSVFVHGSVGDSQREEILTRFAQKTGIRWERLRERFGPDTEQWPAELAAHRVDQDLAADIIKTAQAVQARSPSKQTPETFAALQQSFEEIAKSLRNAPG